MKKFSIVIPLYNEEENIHELYRRLGSSLQKDFSLYSYEIVFVDDGSHDKTLLYAKELHEKDPRIKIVRLSRNFGHHMAITAGLDHATGDYVITMDGDLQDQPEELHKLFAKMQEGFDVVYGERQNKKFSFIKRLRSTIFWTIMRWLIGEDIVINSHIFRIMTRQVVDEVKRLRETNRYVVGLIGWVGFRHSSIPVEHGARFRGETKYTMRKLINLAGEAVVSFSDFPLRLITRVGFFLVLFSCGLIGYVITQKLVYGIPVKGWASLITAVFFVGGVQIFVLGVLGEYIGRIYMETKQRSLYVVKNFVSRDVE